MSIFKFLRISDNLLLLVLLVLAGVMEFWHLGSQPVKEFDEAHFAANAYEMMQNHDYVNLYYLGEPDTWVARPPLKAWLIILGYKTLGYNEWGLRLSSGISILFFFYFAFRLTNLYVSKKEAFLIGLILLAVKGIIGFHVGRNADMDAELIFFLTAFTYYFLSYVDFHKHTIVYAGFFLALSFLLKTTACFYYLPGLLLYLIFTGRMKKSLGDIKLWLCLGMLALTITGWIAVNYFYGIEYPTVADGYHQNKNSIETMFFYDTWLRFTSNHFDGHTVEVNHLFFIHAIDSIFNVWNYFFYAGLIFFIYILYKKRTSLTFDLPNRLLLLSACILLPIILLLTFGMHKLNWYTAPSLIFMAVFSSRAILELSKLHKAIPYVISGLLLFTLVRNIIDLENSIEEQNEVLFLSENKKVWGNAEHILFIKNIPQNVYVYFLWQGKKVDVLTPSLLNKKSSKTILFSMTSLLPTNVKPIVVSSPEKHVKSMVLANPY